MTVAVRPPVGPRIVKGAPTPLFERLIDLDPLRPSEPEPFATLGPDGLQASIRRELERLFDTRRAVTVDAAAPNEDTDLTVLEYGLPDALHLSPDGVEGRRALALALQRIIAAFEPRLRHPKVILDAVPNQPGKMRARVTGAMVSGTVVEQISFPLDLDGAGGQQHGA